MKGRELTPQLSQSSILSLADSHAEFFDACEVLLSASSSENEVRVRELMSVEGPGEHQSLEPTPTSSFSRPWLFPGRNTSKSIGLVARLGNLHWVSRPSTCWALHVHFDTLPTPLS